jgi:predicted ester cyclase
VIEAVNERNLAYPNKLIAQDFSYPTHQIEGLEVMKQIIEEERKGFPDLHVTTEDIVAEGDKVWIRVKETGIHTGEFRSLALLAS